MAHIGIMLRRLQDELEIVKDYRITDYIVDRDTLLQAESQAHRFRNTRVVFLCLAKFLAYPYFKLGKDHCEKYMSELFNDYYFRYEKLEEENNPENILDYMLREFHKYLLYITFQGARRFDLNKPSLDKIKEYLDEIKSRIDKSYDKKNIWSDNVFLDWFVLSDVRNYAEERYSRELINELYDVVIILLRASITHQTYEGVTPCTVGWDKERINQSVNEKIKSFLSNEQIDIGPLIMRIAQQGENSELLCLELLKIDNSDEFAHKVGENLFLNIIPSLEDFAELPLLSRIGMMQHGRDIYKKFKNCRKHFDFIINTLTSIMNNELEYYLGDKKIEADHIISLLTLPDTPESDEEFSKALDYLRVFKKSVEPSPKRLKL